MKYEEVTVEIAEIAGLFAADGNLQHQHISFWGNPIEDKEYYDLRLIKLFQQAFSFTPRPHDKPSNHVYGFYVCRPDIITYFQKTLGFSVGNKTYTVRIPDHIMKHQNPEIWAGFIRGYIDGDGCFTCFRRGGTAHKWKQILHCAPRVSVGSASKAIIQDVSTLLSKLKLKHAISVHKPTGPKQKANHYRITINGTKRVRQYASKVGFSNPAKFRKLQLFFELGFVPPHLSCKQIQAILKGQLCPFTFYEDP